MWWRGWPTSRSRVSSMTGWSSTRVWFPHFPSTCSYWGVINWGIIKIFLNFLFRVYPEVLSSGTVWLFSILIFVVAFLPDILYKVFKNHLENINYTNFKYKNIKERPNQTTKNPWNFKIAVSRKPNVSHYPLKSEIYNVISIRNNYLLHCAKNISIFYIKSNLSNTFHKAVF